MENPVEELVDHLVNCRGAQAMLVVDGSADEMIAQLIGAGWVLEEGVEVVHGKRIRMMRPPAGKEGEEGEVAAT